MLKIRPPLVFTDDHAALVIDALDRILGFRLGKTAVVVWRRNAGRPGAMPAAGPRIGH